MPVLTPHQAAALKYEKHLSLTANAGSGKTFVLSKRYLEIAINEDIQLRNIAAITFTDKAAGELYKKIAKQLDERLEVCTDKKLKGKLEDIRRQLVSANISTIHSFCISILREYPVEAGIDANFVPVDEKTSGELIELSIDEFIKEALIEGSGFEEEVKYFIRIFGSKTLFAAQLVSLIQNRKNLLQLSDNLYSKSPEEIAIFFHKTFLEKAEYIVKKDLECFLESAGLINNAVLYSNPANADAVELRTILGRISKQTDITSLLNSLQIIRELMCTAGGGIKNRGYLSSKLRDDLTEHIELTEELFCTYSRFFLPDNSRQTEYELALFGRKLIEVFKFSLQKYENRKAEQGYLDYEDILLVTQQLIKNDAVKNSLKEKFHYLMIDEYQDTNELQYQIFLPILDDLKSGNLFVVGDEKQSIYMFRDAELEVFDRTKNEIGSRSGSSYLLSLPDSFRMAPNLCLFTNYIFRNLFNSPELIYNEVTHSDIICAREDSIPGGVEFLISESEIDSLKDDEAELTAKRILEVVSDTSKGYNFKDIAVLCRKRKSFSELEHVFIKYNIPFVIVAGKGFFQKQSVFDVYNYFSFLLDKNNNTPLVGILRSPFFSLSDAEIFEISLAEGYTFWEKLQNYSIQNKKFEKAVSSIRENLKLVHNISIAVLLRKILRETGYLAAAAAKTNGSQEISNINKLAAITIDFVSKPFKTLYDYVDFLKESIETVDDESQAALTSDSNAVQIMTLHQSKGLEYPIVFLYKCGDPSRNDSVKTKSIALNKQLGLITKLPLNGDYFSEYYAAPVVGLHNHITEKKNLAEVKRLLYVGITRAKDYLFITAGLPSKGKFPKDSFLGLILSGLSKPLSPEGISIFSGLTKLKFENNEYCNVTEQLSLHIPVRSEVEMPALPAPYIKNKNELKNIAAEPVKDTPQGEIISATKIAVYKQCPLKYQLTYDFGFLPVLMNRPGSAEKDTEKMEEEDFTLQPDSPFSNLSAAKGRIIHKILQDNVTYENLSRSLENAVNKELNSVEYDSLIKSRITEAISADMQVYFNSDSYRYLNSFPDFKNEFEVYVKEADFYLYGIIDKIIFTPDKIIIADYKTDDIKAAEIKERSAAYLNQLKFYSYIVGKLFKNNMQFECRLIFIKHPDNPVILPVSPHELSGFQREVVEIVGNMRKSSYDRNLSHCRKCVYSDSGSCIKK